MERLKIETDLVLYRTSGIHGFGGFARRNIPLGTRIVEYVGEKINKAESLRRCEADNAYIFHFDDEYDLDGSVESNTARFLNHSCAPNCEAEWDEDRIWIVALREIRTGEELTFNYGYDLEDYQDHLCHCGAGNCVGYIVAEEFYETVAKFKETPTG
jgi:SET domain-containing protein